MGGLFGVWEIFLLLDARLAGWFSFDLGLHYSIVFATGFTCKRNWRTTAYHRRSAALEHLWAETGRCFDPDDYWDWPKGSLLGKTPFRMLHCSIEFRSSGKGSNNTDIRGRPHHEHEHGGKRSMASRLKMDFEAHAARTAAWRCQSTWPMDSRVRVCFGRLTATMFPNRSKGRPKHAGGL